MTDKTENIQMIKTQLGELKVKTNNGTVSWEGHQEPKHLMDLSLVPILEQLLTSLKDKEQREVAYFILKCIGTNTKDLHIVDIFLKRLPEENNPYVLYKLFQGIENQIEFHDIQPIMPFLNDRRSLVRHGAIASLRKCKSPEAEDMLLDILRRTKDEYDLKYSLGSLYGVGTIRSLPLLTQLFDQLKGESKAQVLGLLSKLGGAAYQCYFLKAISDRSPIVKWAAIEVIKKHGNEEAITPVLQRVKAILTKVRKVEQSPKSELIEGLEFLNKYRRDNDAINNLFEWIRSKKMDFLFEMEKEQFLALENGKPILE